MSDIDTLLSQPAVQDFIKEHEDQDISKLALSVKWPDDTWPKNLILDQIKARKKAFTKLPTWHAANGITFPSADTVEQASSEATALYKSSIAKQGKIFADLTTGAAIDSWALAPNFQNVHCIELDPNSATIAAHNLGLLRPNTNIHTHNLSAEEYIKKTTDLHDYIYIDPQRRTEHKKGLYAFEKCTPNIIEMMPQLLEKSKTLIIKSSPMVSISGAIQELGNVTEVHIVEWQNQCKEILFIIQPNTEQQSAEIKAVRLNNNGSVRDSETALYDSYKNAQNTYTLPQKYLYEPSPAYQKSGTDMMSKIEKNFNVQKLAPDTHLFTSNTPIKNFPGRAFEIIDQYNANKKSIPFRKANLTIRNFPSTVENLRKKLALKEGGEDYLFACTLTDNTKTILHCRKIKTHLDSSQAD